MVKVEILCYVVLPQCIKSLQLCPILCNPMNCIARQVPLSMGFSRQECWSELPFPPPGDLPNPGIEPASPALQADSLPLNHLGSIHPLLE